MAGHHWQPPRQHNPNPPTMKRPHFGAPTAAGAPGNPAGTAQPHMGAPTTRGATPSTPSSGAMPHFGKYPSSR